MGEGHASASFVANVVSTGHDLEAHISESNLAPPSEILRSIVDVKSDVNDMVESKSQVSNFVDDGVVDDKVVQEFRPPLRVPPHL